MMNTNCGLANNSSGREGIVLPIPSSRCPSAGWLDIVCTGIEEEDGGAYLRNERKYCDK